MIRYTQIRNIFNPKQKCAKKNVFFYNSEQKREPIQNSAQLIDSDDIYFVGTVDIPKTCGISFNRHEFSFSKYPTHKRIFFRNLIKSNRNYIVFTIFRLIWNQTDANLPIEYPMERYHLICVKYDIRIRKILKRMNAES